MNKIFYFNLSISKSKQAFTLVELLVSITIVGMLMLIAYAPYQYYEKKSKLRLASREISQSFYEAKNMAISGIKGGIEDEENVSKENKSVGLYLASGATTIDFYTYSYNTDTGSITIGGKTPIKTRDLQEGVKIRKLTIGEEGREINGLLLYYIAVDGILHIYDGNGEPVEIGDNENIRIKFSFLDADLDSTLAKTLIYFPKTNVVDYE